MSDFIQIERSGAVVTVMLNRPEKLNAISKPMWKAIDVVFTGLSADDSVRCIVVRGAGEKAFSAGADISEFEIDRCDKIRGAEYGRVVHSAISAMENCRHPIIAQIHGVCVGGGLVVASLCDIRICGESSRFGVPVKNLGLVEAYPEIAPMLRLTGPDIGLEILLEGRVFGAVEAKEKRLVSRVVADILVADEARATARRVAEGAPLSARWHKKFARRLSDPRAISKAEYEECFDCFDTEDFRVGYQAFLAKQRPSFVGK